MTALSSFDPPMPKPPIFLASSAPRPPLRGSQDVCRLELEQILDGRLLTARFRPVASLGGCAIVGHIGTVSGPQGALLYSAPRLFAVAADSGQLPRLIRQFLSVVMGQHVREGGEGRLFLLLPEAAVAWMGAGLADLIRDAAEEAGLPVSRGVMVVPWLGGLAGLGDLQRAAAVAHACRTLGFAVASSGLECARSDAGAVDDEAPDYVLLDEGQLDSSDADLLAGSALAERVRHFRDRGCKLLAQGVGGWRELRAAERLGVDLVAGDFIGRVNRQASLVLSAAAYKSMRKAGGPAGEEDGNSIHLLQRLKIDVAPVMPETPAEMVFATFDANPRLRAVAVVRDGVPAGLISRYEMIDNMARPYRHELYGRKPCTRFMDREPIVVDVRLSLTELTDIFVHADPRHLVSGFIVTEGGRYAGMGSVQDLMREITAMQIEAARYANPLTQLPGNVPINQHIDTLLAAGTGFTVCYCDLDHFKPFNDVYGYARGDQMIALTARILTECVEPDIDFIGHVGGDDFILVMVSQDWVGRCERALKLFEEEILGFFSHDDIERGGYVTENRKGRPEFYRLTSLSIGAVEVAPGRFANHLQVSTVASEVKKRAKAIVGNSLYVNRRHYGGEDAPAESRPD